MEERRDLALLWGFLEVKRERRRCPWRGWLRPGALAGDLPSGEREREESYAGGEAEERGREND